MKKIVYLLIVLVTGISPEVCAQEAGKQQATVSEVTLDRMHKEAQQAYETGDYQTSLQTWQTALEQARVLSDKQFISRFLKEIGRTYNRLRQYEQALESFEQALSIHQEIGNRQDEARDLNDLGDVYKKLWQYEYAVECYQQALSIRRELGDQSGEGDTLVSLGLTYDDLGQYERALEYHTRSLAIHREIGDQRWEGGDLNNIGRAYQYLGQYERALEYFTQALVIHREIGNRQWEAVTLGNLGVVYRDLGQYARALEYSEQALAIEREIGDRRGEAGDMGTLGTVYQALGQYERAVKYFTRAVAICREIGDRYCEGGGLGNLGVVYDNLGQYERTLEYYTQALTIFREIDNRQWEALTLNNLGIVYKNLGQYQKATEAFQESLSVYKSVGIPDVWRAQCGLASIEVKLNQPESAITHYEQALDTIEALRVGLTEKEHKLSFMQNKLFIYDELIDLLHDQHRQHPDKGYDHKALEIFERKQGRVFLEEMGQSGARLFAGLPEVVSQREFELETQLEQARKQSVNERSKSITVQNKDLIHNLDARVNTLQTEQAELQAQIKSEYPDYYALKYPTPVSPVELQQQVLKADELVLVYNVMEEKTLLWLICPEKMQMFTLSVGEQKLQEQVTALRRAMAMEWQGIRGKQGTEDGTQSPKRRGFKIGSQAERENIINFNTDGGERTTFAQRSYDLYRVLIPKEIRPLLTSGHTLHLVPTGPLYALPFESLATRTVQNIQSVHYLIQEIPIGYLSSASLLKTLREAQTRRKPPAPYPLLAFAHPVYEEASSSATYREGDPSLRPLQRGNVSFQALRSQAYHEFLQGSFTDLPETAEEVREIAQLLNAPQESEPLQLQENASRKNVFIFNNDERLDDYHYLVFATHGVLPGEVDHVRQPALVLSYPDRNGYLTMTDVFQLQLNAKLVSLSACNTGSGGQVRGEGVMGLTRAFMYAGTPAIAVTLWPVETFSAKALNVGMFEHLKAGQSPVQALRSIKLQMLRGEKGEAFTHPYYWAPFVLFGDGN